MLDISSNTYDVGVSDEENVNNIDPRLWAKIVEFRRQLERDRAEALAYLEQNDSEETAASPSDELLNIPMPEWRRGEKLAAATAAATEAEAGETAGNAEAHSEASAESSEPKTRPEV